MEELAPRLQWMLRSFLAVILIFSVRASGLQTSVCSPSNISEPLSCTNHQWVRIVEEIYAPQTGQGPTCKQNISTCNGYFYDTGMLTNCNGPARGGACREEVDVDAARRVTTCLRDVTDVATLIRYNCIEGSSVFNLCDTNVTMWTSDLPLYLASPSYAQSTPAGQMCTCDVQGSNLKMNAVEIKVMSKLDWGDHDTGRGNYSDMFAVTSGSTVLWRSSNCAGCTTTNLVNSNLFLPVNGARYPKITVTYSDFGVSGQNVWVEIFESGPSISVSCHSTPLPPNKVITTTTAAATTSASTKGVSTTSQTSTIPPAQHRTDTPLTGSAASPTTPLTEIAASSNTQVPTSHGLFPGSTSAPNKTDAGILNLGKQEDPSGEVTLIVTLTVILCVLVVTAIILGILIYRKRHILKSDDYISPWALIVNWYHRILKQKQKQGTYQDSGNCGNFDSILTQDQARQQRPGKSLSNVRNSGNPSAENPEATQQCEDNDSSLIPLELYQSHQQLLDEELDKMRRERSSKATLKMSTNIRSGDIISNSKSLGERSMREPDSERTSIKRNVPESEAVSTPGQTGKEVPYAGSVQAYVDPFYTNDVSDDDDEEEEEDGDGDEGYSNINTDKAANIGNHASELQTKDQARLCSEENKLFELLGINTDPQIHSVRGRQCTKNAPVTLTLAAKEDNIRESDVKKKLVPRSPERELNCKNDTVLEPAAFFHNKKDSGSLSQHLQDRKISKPDTVSDIIQKCSQHIRDRRKEMSLPTTHNTGTANTRTNGESDTVVQTSEC